LAVSLLESWKKKVPKYRPLPSSGTKHLEKCETYFHEIFGTATEMFTQQRKLHTFFFLAITTAATSTVKNVFNEHCKITETQLMPNTLRRRVFRF
jgi:hypothetical protein